MTGLVVGLFALTSFAPRAAGPVGLAELNAAEVARDPGVASSADAGVLATSAGDAGLDLAAASAPGDGGVSMSADDAGIPAAPDAPHVWRVQDLTDDPEVEIEEVTVGKASFVGRLARTHTTLSDVFRIQRAFDKVVKLDKTAESDRIVIARKKSTRRLVALEYIASPRDVWQAKEEDGVLLGRRLTLEPARERLVRALVVHSDLHAACTESGVPDDVLAAIEDSLSGRLPLGHVPAGSRIKFVATREKMGSDGRVTIDALECATGKSSFRVYYFDPRAADEGMPLLSLGQLHKSDVLRGYYDDDAKRSERGDFRAPLGSTHVSSRFNPRRMHPVLHTVMPHNGIDFAAPTGTPVYATADGVVKSLGDGGPCGNMVQVDHGKGLVTAYCHLSRIAAGLYVGEAVHGRMLLGYVGQTGRATGPHLHFAVKRNDRFVDPLTLRMDRVHSLGGVLKHAFEAHRKALDPELDHIDATRIDMPLSAAEKGDAGANAALDDDGAMLDDLNP